VVAGIFLRFYITTNIPWIEQCSTRHVPWMNTLDAQPPFVLQYRHQKQHGG
jgi:hypothetical protein